MDQPLLMIKQTIIEAVVLVLLLVFFPLFLLGLAIIILAIYLIVKLRKSKSSNVNSETMHAAIYSKNGAFVVKEIKIPEFSKNQLLIEVKAASINPVDYKLRINEFPFVRWFSYHTVGRDFSGVIVDLGENVQNYRIGDEVYGNAAGGSLQRYTVVEQNHIALKPRNMTFIEASAIGLAAGTSLQALKFWGELDGKSVLVIGASGGCGSFGVQIAKYYNARVFGVCSSKNIEFVKSLGTDEVLDYTKENYLESIQGFEFDLIYDTVSSQEDGDLYPAYGSLLNHENGKYVAINGTGKHFFQSILSKICKKSFEKPNFHITLLDWNTKDLNTLTEIAESNKLSTKVNIYSFNETQINEAFSELKSRRVVGKIVFELNSY